MRVVMTIGLTVAIIGAAACDPGYGVGARLHLAPTTSDSCILIAMSQPSFVYDGKKVDRKRGSTFQVSMGVPRALADSAPWMWDHALLSIGPARDSTLPVELIATWIGTAHTVRLSDQRRFIGVATAQLEQVRTACAAASAAKIECVAVGLGGHPACEHS